MRWAKGGDGIKDRHSGFGGSGHIRERKVTQDLVQHGGKRNKSLDEENTNTLAFASLLSPVACFPAFDRSLVVVVFLQMPLPYITVFLPAQERHSSACAALLSSSTISSSSLLILFFIWL